MTRPRQLMLALIVLFGVQLHLPASLGAEQSSQAALVVDYGNGVVTYAIVPFDGDEISGIDLLRESGLSLVSIEFGGLGEGVCSIEEHGCGVADCRRLCQSSNPNSAFWHYFSLDEAGSWELQPRGASSSTVTAGQVDGWSWTEEDPAFPDVDFADVVAMAGKSDAEQEPFSTTYDAAGQVLVESDDGQSWLEYAMALALAGGVAVMIVVVVRRNRQSVESR